MTATRIRTDLFQIEIPKHDLRISENAPHLL